ncbi:MAG: hypothetical protein IJ563_00450 [Selenomonadaceae bacterium]|nr:hypothetical protein [Selenomonadaceae bacterium]MBR1859083.1 hypothetical protein [Selenomonadaceae bacterium]
MRVKLTLIAATIIMLFNLIASSVSAELVTVIGYGVDEQSAINDAKRNAVEQVVGTVLKSKSVTQDLELVTDIIQTRTQGYINHFEILSKTEESGNVTIKAKVDVSSEPSSSLMKDIELVMSLHDPKIAVVIDYYGDDNSVTYKKYPTMTSAAIREELLKCGFTHIMDSTSDVDYVIVGKLTVNKSQSIRLPNWSNIGSNEYDTVDTGLSKTTATLDCTIKKSSTNEIIGEFHVAGEDMSASENDIQTPAVSKMASNAAQEVRKIFNREASKAFY